LHTGGLPNVGWSSPKESVDAFPDECSFHEQQDLTTEAVSCMAEPSTDQEEHCYSHRECHPAQRLIENT